MQFQQVFVIFSPDAIMYNFLTGRLIFVRIILLLAVLALIAIGIAAIYAVGNPADTSSTANNDEIANSWKKQLVFAGIGLVGFILANLVNYRWFGAASYWIYAFVLLLLTVVLAGKYINLPFVPMINGTHRWIRFHTALPRIQPSEFCKLAYVLALAWYLRYRSNYRNFTVLIGPFGLTLLPVVLILLEPDLGTAMLIMPVFFILLAVAGAKPKHLLIIVLMALLVSPFLWRKMRPYQRMRISSVLMQHKWVQEKAEKYPIIGTVLLGRKFSTKQWEDDWGYHLIRSKYAVASGGVKGQGYRRGPFVKYNFLPARHNDFIFAAIAHQWGFWGALGLLSLYVIIIACGLKIAGNNTDPFARLLATGITAVFAVEVIVNVGMTLGLMPITGLTLPLVSYGGSSLLVSITAIGLLNNAGRHRPFSVSPKSFE